VAPVPMRGGEVREEGDFELDGVTLPAAENKLEVLDPGGDKGAGERGGMFPSGAPVDWLAVPGVGRIEATLINAGNPTIFIEAESLGLRGTELQSDVNGNLELLARAEAMRAQGAVAMGLGACAAEATAKRPHTPKLAFIAKPRIYTASDGKLIDRDSIDVLARIFSMDALHHAITGTVALAAAAAVPGTLVHRVCPVGATGRIRFGHLSGTLSVGAEVCERDGHWIVTKALMSFRVLFHKPSKLLELSWLPR
jgi:2-methylaconitate isomerase